MGLLLTIDLSIVYFKFKFLVFSVSLFKILIALNI